MFKVSKRLGRNETELQRFVKLTDAEQFIFEKLREDQTYKVISSYAVYEGFDLLKEYTEKDLPPEVQASGAGQAGSGQSFSPTPLAMSPRPASLPRSGFKDEEKDDKKNP